MSEPNFDTYKLEELFEAIESIDYDSYPKRTIEIVERILLRLNISASELIEMYDDKGSLQILAFFTGLGMEENLISSRTREKLMRVAKMLNES